MVSRPGTLRICGECGALAARRKSQCGVCGASSLSAREVPTTPGVTWVRLTASFTCRGCGQKSALDGLDVDGTVTCAACAMTQAFDLDAWSSALDFAHGLADLGAPGAPLDFDPSANPFSASGETESTFHFETKGLRTVGGVQRTASIAIDACVGHPLCGRCKASVLPTKSGDALTTTCTGCGAIATYTLPTPAGPVHPYPSAIIADDARTDGSAARLETEASGVVAIRCPSCNASLTNVSAGSLIECAYCRTSCRVPSRMLATLGVGAREPRPFLLAFMGPSSLRARIVTSATQARAQLESSRGIEAIPALRSTPQQQLLRMLICIAFVVGVGALYLPRMMQILDARGGPSSSVP